MQRRATKNTRAANSAEKKFMSWIKNQPCCVCGNPPPSIADHSRGSTFRHNKVLIGHWFVLPYCAACDSVKTLGSHNAHYHRFGVTQSDLWLKVTREYDDIPIEVVLAISDWSR